MGHTVLRILGWAFLVIRFILPPLLRFLWWLVAVATSLAFAGVAAVFRGIPQSMQIMADSWSSQIVERGIPPLTVERLNPVLRVWAFMLIFIGWVVIVVVVGIIVRMII